MQSFLDIWNAYKEGGGKQSATELGIFLIRNAESLDKQEQHFSQPAASPDFYGSVNEKPAEMPPVSNPNSAAILVGRLQRFVFMESKPVLKESGLDNPDDFGLLASLYFKPFISKGQLLRQSLIEPATGTEIIKRMKKAGWIEEKPNPEDGRSLLVALTAKGIELTEKCFKNLAGITNTLDSLTGTEQVILMNLLQKLDHYHSNRHQVKTVFNWMAGEIADIKR
jgi:MarR family transcriptional regulator, lower aerobic nicotinate degradation pathway regulator